VFDLSTLNEDQEKAVRTTEGAVLVLAGAGTGKTRVLTSRIAYIISERLCQIGEILAVTFTNKAAKEMKERTISILSKCENIFSNKEDFFWIGTFHSLALRMIRPFYEKFKRTSNFSIIDADDQLRLIKKIMKDYEIDDKKNAPKQIAYHINRWKDQCRNPDEAKKMSKRFGIEQTAANIYYYYQDLLESLDAIDFGDIVKISIELFKCNIEILEKYQNKFKYIMVDEYQDTNVAQYIWLKLLSMSNGNLCCVGDDDQSIYSWRGADVGNILKFDKDFKNTTIIRLGQNYRSTKNIIKAASGLISNNSMRMEKEFWTNEDVGLPVMVKSLPDPMSEAHFIAGLIENKSKNGISTSDMAILVRGAFQTRVFEERMLALGIPYTVIGGMKFYERKEVKDAIAYLRLAVNPEDGIAFERVINVPKRGIGTTSMNKFYAVAKEYNLSLPKAARKIAEGSTGSFTTKLLDFLGKIEDWNQNNQTLSPSKLMQKILEESGYASMLKESKTIENEARLETLDELVIALQEFDDVHEFLDYISLVLENSDSLIQDKVTISTIHAAKGLEYHTVFIPGFEENILPHQRSVAEKGEIGVEEERRLCYVAITRAKKEAYITLCNRRNMYGSYDNSYVNPSRFLYDLPRESIKIL
jgi:DNA helicase-2/ATP-dependent DNA helicase PcrA